jgi:hypothetical protein
VCAAILALSSVGGCGYATDAADTTFQETKASTLLKKYAWFKDTAAALDAKRATIQQYEVKIKRLQDQYQGVSRKDWSREDASTINQWETELDGYRASYNNLAADYNSQMSKANWRFCNVGDLPQGAAEPLPREFKAYITAE